MERGWCKIKGGVAYTGIGERKFRDLPKEGLRHIRLPSGTLLFKYEWIDDFLLQYEVTENEVEDIVNEVVRDFNQ